LFDLFLVIVVVTKGIVDLGQTQVRKGFGDLFDAHSQALVSDNGPDVNACFRNYGYIVISFPSFRFGMYGCLISTFSRTKVFMPIPLLRKNQRVILILAQLDDSGKLSVSLQP